jgi:hypothetical protein
MSKVQTDLVQYEEAAKQLKQKAEEMLVAIKAVDSSITTLNSSSIGNRIKRDYETWMQLKSSSEKILQQYPPTADQFVKSAGIIRQAFD